MFLSIRSFSLRLVDANIVRILRQRVNECKKWYDRDYEDMDRFCKPYIKDHEEAATNFFIRCKRFMFACLVTWFIVSSMCQCGSL